MSKTSKPIKNITFRVNIVTGRVHAMYESGGFACSYMSNGDDLPYLEGTPGAGEMCGSCLKMIKVSERIQAHGEA